MRLPSNFVIPNFKLPGLTADQSIRTICAHLFEPAIIQQFDNSLDALEWSHDFVRAIIEGRPKEAVDIYKASETTFLDLLNEMPGTSLLNPPFSMASGDGKLPSLPWRTPGHETMLVGIVSGLLSSTTPFGELLQIAFVTDGGPGSSVDTALRVRARTQTVRVFSEHWLLRLYRASSVQETHFALNVAQTGRRFSQHRLHGPDGRNEVVVFDTTHSWQREQQDFIEFLDEYDLLARWTRE